MGDWKRNAFIKRTVARLIIHDGVISQILIISDHNNKYYKKGLTSNNSMSTRLDTRILKKRPMQYKQHKYHKDYEKDKIT